MNIPQELKGLQKILKEVGDLSLLISNMERRAYRCYKLGFCASCDLANIKNSLSNGDELVIPQSCCCSAAAITRIPIEGCIWIYWTVNSGIEAAHFKLANDARRSLLRSLRDKSY